jgi:hypothetical protein
MLCVTGCSSPEHQIDLALHDDATCTASALGDVRVISVELLGQANGALCSLGKRCVFDVGTIASMDDVVGLLAEANQPLVDVADEDAHTVAILGHTESCWGADDLAMCGYAALAEARGGALEVGLACMDCAPADVPFCP